MFFYFAFLTGQTELLKKLFYDSSFEDYIKKVMKHIISYHAAEKEQLEIFQFIITNQNPDEINYWFCDYLYIGGTPLHIAAENGHLSVCKLIIPHLRDQNPPRRYNYGRIPLHLAAINGHFDVFKLFFENIKNPKNQFWEGETPLHLAAEKGHFDICNFIIQKLDAKKNPKENKNRTPLHHAAKNGFYSICELILQNVRIKCPKDETGVTPLHLAEKYGHLEICQLFEKKPKKRKIR